MAKAPGTTPAPWFTVDRAGLASLLDRRGREWALYELIQNGWDQDVTRVTVTVASIDAKWAVVIVDDDDPEGFADLADAYTVFARSRKRGNVEKRGRFNLGEKLVLAICRSARVISTTGSVVFDHTGRYLTDDKTERGSRFEGEVAMTRKQVAAALQELKCLIPPTGIVTTINGDVLPSRTPIATLTTSLMTEADDESGVLRRCTRQGTISLYDPLVGEKPTLYEMGIPVCESGNRWHCDVSIKVPLTIDRENVPPAYFRALNLVVANRMVDVLTVEDVATPWVNDALSNPGISPATVKAIIDQRFGVGAVARDPSDPEANMRAQDEDRTVVSSRSLSSAQWENVRKAREVYGIAAVLGPAGIVTPTPRPFVDGDKAPKWVTDPTTTQREVVAYAQWLHNALFRDAVTVSLIDDPKWNFNAAYGWNRLYLNVKGDAKPGDFAPDTDYINALLLHEYAHRSCGNHFSEDYHRAICKLGAAFRRLPQYVNLNAVADPVPTSASDEVEAA